MTAYYFFSFFSKAPRLLLSATHKHHRSPPQNQDKRPRLAFSFHGASGSGRRSRSPSPPAFSVLDDREPGPSTDIVIVIVHYRDPLLSKTEDVHVSHFKHFQNFPKQLFGNISNFLKFHFPKINCRPQPSDRSSPDLVLQFSFPLSNAGRSWHRWQPPGPAEYEEGSRVVRA